MCSTAAASTLTRSTAADGTYTYTYLWESRTDVVTFAPASGTNNTIGYTPGALTQTTWYRRTVTSGGCTNTTAAIQITVNPVPTVSISPSSAAFCSGNSVTLTASCSNCGASPTYAWSPATDLSITTGSVVNAHPVVTTTYTVTVTGANGCTGTASVTITVTPTPEGDLSSDPPVCSGSNSGTLVLSNYSGTIVRWESSTDGGVTWTPISNTSTTNSYS